MGLRDGVQRGLLAFYCAANRKGLLDSRLAEVAFQQSYFLYKYFVEDPFARLIAARPEIFAGGHIIDVGANIGYTATLFAKAVEAPFRVHAFEPEARNFRWLVNAIERTGCGARVVAHRAAVGSREGAIDLWHNAGHHADHRVATDKLRRSTVEGRVEQVPLTTVDAHIAAGGWQPVSFVKIDVQGFEPEVLRGMAETIRQNPGIHVAVEVAPVAIAELGFDPVAFLDELVAALPRMAILERDGTLVPAQATAILARTKALGELGYVDVLCSRT